MLREIFVSLGHIASHVKTAYSLSHVVTWVVVSVLLLPFAICFLVLCGVDALITGHPVVQIISGALRSLVTYYYRVVGVSFERDWMTPGVPLPSPELVAFDRFMRPFAGADQNRVDNIPNMRAKMTWMLHVSTAVRPREVVLNEFTLHHLQAIVVGYARDSGTLARVQAASVPHQGDRVLLFFHGGGFMFGSYEYNLAFYGSVARKLGCKVVGLNYRLVPEHTVLDAVEDCVTAYNWLVDERGVKPGNIIVGGESAGGALSLLLLQALMQQDKPLPAAGVPVSPVSDIFRTQDSARLNGGRDNMLSGEKWVVEHNEWMDVALRGKIKDVPEGDRKLYSPLYGKVEGLPPLHITASEPEMLRDDSIVFARKAMEHGVDVEMYIQPHACHVYPMFVGLFPEAESGVERICQFMRRQWNMDGAQGMFNLKGAVQH